MKALYKLLLRVLLSTAMAGFCAVLVIVLYCNAKLPSVDRLENVQLQVPLKIYTSDGKLIGEYGQKRRTPIKIEDIPEQLKRAILATEDRRFYEHPGVDIRGLLRASLHLMLHGTKEQGASTITMQVARNFFLTRKKTFSRKLNEILLALKIEKELSKDKILELYLNKIYFGKRAYGVQAAAQVYYGTTVKHLNLAQIAMIAGLPQAPSAINPLNNPKAALKRRGHVLKRMRHYEFISEREYQHAQKAPLTARYHGRRVDVNAPFIAEMARQECVKKFGPKVYELGLEAYTTVDSRLQALAQEALRSSLLAYDKRHGYRGPIRHIDLTQMAQDSEEVTQILQKIQKAARLLPALVTEVQGSHATARLSNHQSITIPFAQMAWAKPQKGAYLGQAPENALDVLTPGDIIYVEPGKNSWKLGQLPQVSAALVSLDPQDGAILALMGGYDFQVSRFNRATQAKRQPGSNFKPFIYTAALENGFTAASIINDAPIIYEDNNLESDWRPQNVTRRFYGPTRIRVGMTKSRNLVSIRLLQAVGIANTLEVVKRFGFNDLPSNLSLALGTASVTPLEVATGYATFANHGFKVEPYLIHRIEKTPQHILYQAQPKRACPECSDLIEASFEDPSPLSAQAIISPQVAYIMNSILKDAIVTGTGRRALKLKRPDLGGKTGTTNDNRDAWYTGYQQNMVTTVWMGFDDPKSLKEYASQTALPLWMQFMGPALKSVPIESTKAPKGIVTVKIDPRSGLLARPGQKNAIFEVFTQETVPYTMAPSAPHRGQILITPTENSAQEALF